MNRRSAVGEVGGRVVDQCLRVAVHLELVDRVRPRPVEGGELVLAREQGGRTARVVDDVEDRGHAVAVRTGHGAARELVVPRDPVAARVGVDPAAGEHAGMVGQRDGLLHLGARVERRGTLVEEPPEGAVRPERVQRAGVEPVDRDCQHVAPAVARGLGRRWRGLGWLRGRRQVGVGAGDVGAVAWSGAAAVSLSLARGRALWLVAPAPAAGGRDRDRREGAAHQPAAPARMAAATAFGTSGSKTVGMM